MATKGPSGQWIIAAGEVGAFSVCPLSWKLKWIDKEEGQGSESGILGQKLHSDWASVFEESLVLLRRVRFLATLIITAVVTFLLIHPPEDVMKGPIANSIKTNGLQLLVLAGASALVIRAFLKAARKTHRNAGFLLSEVAVAMEGSSIVPAREYVSARQGLAGKPDALVKEGEEILPVERKPLAKKLRDRYIAQILIYMRLVEEFEGRRPSKGYLILGPQCRRVVVENTKAKQVWVDDLLNRMRAILHGVEAKPTPHPTKCAKCDVRHRCHARADNTPSSS